MANFMKTKGENLKKRSAIWPKTSLSGGVCLVFSVVSVFQLSGCRLYDPSSEMDESSATMAREAELADETSDRGSRSGWKELAPDASSNGRVELDRLRNTAPATITESTAVQRAMSDALEVGLAQIAVLDARAQNDLAHSMRNPKVIGLFDIGDDGESLPSNVTSPGESDIGAGLYLRQDILTWGAHRRRISAAQEMEGREEALREQMKNDIAAAVHLAFANLRRIDASSKACQTTAVSYREFGDLAKSRIEAGVEAGRASTEIASRIAELDAQRAMIELEAESTRTLLQQLLGLPATTTFTLYPVAAIISSADKISDPAVLIDATQGQRSDIAALESEIRAAEHEIAATKADRLPKFSVSAGSRAETDTHFNRNEAEFTAGIRSRWTPFDGGGHTARTELAKNRLSAARLKLDHTREAAATEIRSNIESLKKAHTARRATAKALALTKESLKLMAEQQDAKRTSTDQLLEPQERIFRAIQQQAIAEFAERRAAIQLKRSLGEFVHTPRQGHPLDESVPVDKPVAMEK